MASLPFRRAAVLLSLPFALSAATWYIDPNNGQDSNAGTSETPWKTISKAVGGGGAAPAIQPGDTVVLRSGIHRIASGNRCIEGVWFGGVQDIGPVRYIEGPYAGASTGPIDHAIVLGGVNPKLARGVQIVNCTIWGYHSGAITGSVEYALFQGNRLVNNGDDGLWHGIYLSGQDGRGDGQSNHIIVDNNLFIGGAGYGIQAWHTMRDVILSRNFVAAHNWGSVLDGTGHLQVNNQFWKQRGESRSQLNPWGPWLNAWNTRFYNNIIGPAGWVLVSDPTRAESLDAGANAYALWSAPPAANNASVAILQGGQRSQERVTIPIG